MRCAISLMILVVWLVVNCVHQCPQPLFHLLSVPSPLLIIHPGQALVPVEGGLVPVLDLELDGMLVILMLMCCLLLLASWASNQTYCRNCSCLPASIRIFAVTVHVCMHE